MIEPIVLTEHGETLVPYNRQGYTDQSKLSDCIGRHDKCKGHIEIMPVSETHKALVCSWCHLRIVVPNSVDTYKKLRQFAKEATS